MRVGVISDTHGLLRPEALDLLVGAEHIVHAGDIGGPNIVPALAQIAPVTAIRGNVDRAAWAQNYPEETTVNLAGREIHVVHDVNALTFDPAEAGLDAVISGHSHRPRVERREGVLYLNPGSAGRRRFRLPVALAILQIGDPGLDARISEIPV